MSFTEDQGLFDVYTCWEQFVAGAEPDLSVLNPKIASAWQRCVAAGVDPRAGRSPLVLNEAEVQEMMQRHQDLIAVARPFMNKLHQFVAGSGFVVLLADERGYLMHVTGDSGIFSGARNINFERGACWREDEIGNNGVGTALVLKKPVQMSGAEHFCQKHHGWTCSGAPLFDDHNRMIGILEMSGPVEKAHLHTLGMVVAAVAAITDQLRVNQKNRELVMVNDQISKIFNTVSDGIISLDRQGRVTQVNPAVNKVLGRSGRQIIGAAIQEQVEPSHHVQEMLASGRGFAEAEMMMMGTHCLVSGQSTIDDRGEISGGVLFVNPINKIKNLVNRFSGAQASFQFSDIIGHSDEIARAIRNASLAASSESNVLLEGESGTGKEVFAQAIHNASPRRNHPFVAVNCGAIPRELLGSELFGYEEGAFTGARRGGRPGKFELASGGTIFLDEIGEMPLGKQVSLLRVLQERTVTRIGGSKVIPVDVRVICASNRNLQEEVRKGNFRRDLFYRLNVIAITLPTLRRRPEDIPQLFDHFLEDICRKMGVERPQVKSEVIARLQEYDWPGNVRELQNVVERMVNITGGGTIELEHLPEEMLAPATVAGGEEFTRVPIVAAVSAERKRRKEAEADKERQEIMALLVLHGGNITQVAKSLGVSRNTIYRKIKQYECR